MSCCDGSRLVEVRVNNVGCVRRHRQKVVEESREEKWLRIPNPNEID